MSVLIPNSRTFFSLQHSQLVDITNLKPIMTAVNANRHDVFEVTFSTGSYQVPTGMTYRALAMRVSTNTVTAIAIGYAPTAAVDSVAAPTGFVTTPNYYAVLPTNLYSGKWDFPALMYPHGHAFDAALMIELWGYEI